MKPLSGLCYAILLAAITSGCWTPIPHTSMKTPSVRGIVLDAVTKEPIVGAHVRFAEYAVPLADTDMRGEFILKETRNLHLAAKLGICGDSWPSGEYSDTLRVMHPAYGETTIKVRRYVADRHTNYKDSGRCWVLREILLQKAVTTQ